MPPPAQRRGQQQDPTRPAAASRALGDASAGAATQSPGGAATGPHPLPPLARSAMWPCSALTPPLPAAGPDAASSSLARARRRKRRRRHPSASADPSPIHTNRRSSQKPPGAQSAPTGPGRPALDLHQQDPSARRSICTIKTRPPSFSRHELSKSSWIYPRNSTFHGFLQGMSSIDQSFAFYDLGLGMNGYGLI